MGAHTANTDREAGFRGSAGVLAVVYDNSGTFGWVEDQLFLSASHSSELLGGLELFGGWAVPGGDEVGDPLMVVGGRAATELPVTAWGGELRSRGTEVLEEVGVRGRGGLVQPRARLGATVGFTWQRLRASMDIGVLVRARSASGTIRAPQSDGTSEHPDPSFAVGAIF